MKIAFVGNQDNNAYRLCGWCRELGIEANLYVLSTWDRNHRSGPELIDRDLGGSARPDWLKSLEGLPRLPKWKRAIFPVSPNADTRRIAREYDVVVTSGRSGLLASRYFREAPLVHMSLGAEVTEYPWLLLRRGVSRVDRIFSWQIRHALRRCDAVLTGYMPTVRSLARLGHLHKTRLWGFAEDLQANPKRVDQPLLQELNDRYGSCELVFIWLSRLNFRDPASHNYKGPERFLEAFERIVHSNRANVRAVIGNHGNDAAAIVEQVEQKGLAPHVDFVPHLPYWQLLTYLSINNAVGFDIIDEERGTLTGFVREGLSVGAMVAQAIHHEAVEVCCGPDCPIMSTPSAQACYDVMARLLCMSPSERDAYRQKCSAWARKYLDHREAVWRFFQIVQETAFRVKVGTRPSNANQPDLDGLLRVVPAEIPTEDNGRSAQAEAA